MRALAGVLIAFALFAVSASAAQVDPSLLVLQARDVPAGFRIDTDETSLRTNEREAKDHPETRSVFRRLGRVTGYQARYENEKASIEARVDLFTSASGARGLQRWVVREMQRSGIKGLVGARAGIGSEGRVYSLGAFAIVYWRYGRAWSGIAGFGIPKNRTLALARTQQRRIAAALG